jgi:hypothetical protein
MEYTMKTRILLPALLLSAVFVSPAFANWFHNPTWNINRAISSAPNPTPEDIRLMRQPTLVQDSAGNIIAMFDPNTGRTLATAEPVAPAQAIAASANRAPAARAR